MRRLANSFLKTMKWEAIYTTTYRDRNHLRTDLAAFIDEYYNGTHLHSALGYRPPNELECGLVPGLPLVPHACSFSGPHSNKNGRGTVEEETAVNQVC